MKEPLESVYPTKNLPKEIWTHISGYLTPRETVQLMQVNKKINTAFKSSSEVALKHKITQGKLAVFSSGGHTFILTQYRGAPLLLAGGSNTEGQLGLGNTIKNTSLTRVALPKGLASIDWLETYATSTLIIGRDKENNFRVFGCGDNKYGQLGLEEKIRKTSLLTEVRLPGNLESIISVQSVGSHSIILGRTKDNKGVLLVAGKNRSGQLGSDLTKNITTFSPISLPEKLKHIDSIHTTPYALYVWGRDSHNMPLLFACGSNYYGKLGFRSPTVKTSLTEVPLPVDMVSIYSIKTNELTTLVWGYDKNKNPVLAVCGKDHKEAAGFNLLTPLILPPGFVTIDSVCFGTNHQVLLGRDKDNKPLIASWGTNSQGQLGCGDTTNREMPTLIELPRGLHFIDSIHAQFHHTVIVGRNASGDPVLAVCGNNSLGQLSCKGKKITKFTLIQPPKDIASINSVSITESITIVSGSDEKNSPVLLVCGFDKNSRFDSIERTSMAVINKPSSHFFAKREPSTEIEPEAKKMRIAP